MRTGTIDPAAEPARRGGQDRVPLTDLAGNTLGEYEAQRETLQPEGNFVIATATWPVDVAPPGGHHVTAIVYDRAGKELARVAPRLVSTSMQQGY